MNDQPETDTNTAPPPTGPPTAALRARQGNHNACLFYWDDPRPGDTKAQNADRTFIGMARDAETARLVVDALNVVAENGPTQASHLADLRALVRQMNVINDQLDLARGELAARHRALIEALDLADEPGDLSYQAVVDRIAEQHAEAVEVTEDATKLAEDHKSVRAQLDRALAELAQTRAGLARIGPVEHQEFEYAIRLLDRGEKIIGPVSSLDVVEHTLRQAGSPADTRERYEIVRRDIILTAWQALDPQLSRPQRKTWEAGSPELKRALTRVRAANGVVFRNNRHGDWIAVPPVGDGRTYTWAEVNETAVTELWIGDPDYPDPDQ